MAITQERMLTLLHEIQLQRAQMQNVREKLGRMLEDKFDPLLAELHRELQELSLPGYWTEKAHFAHAVRGNARRTLKLRAEREELGVIPTTRPLVGLSNQGKVSLDELMAKSQKQLTNTQVNAPTTFETKIQAAMRDIEQETKSSITKKAEEIYDKLVAEGMNKIQAASESLCLAQGQVFRQAPDTNLTPNTTLIPHEPPHLAIDCELSPDNIPHEPYVEKNPPPQKGTKLFG